MKTVSIAVTQMPSSWDREANIDKARSLVREAASKGVQIVLLPEFFETPYFCIVKDRSYFTEATTVAANPAIVAMRQLAKELDVVIPVSFFERDGERHFNSLAMIDAGGDILGVYRKSHIPDFPAYEELFYFQPGDTGFMVFDTRYAKVGAGICWDQWFPETARILALKGAELLLFPTAIGRPANDSDEEFKASKAHWQQTMQGHAAANMTVLAASNRIGMEAGGAYQTQFYGGSFIADAFGTKLAEAGEDEVELIVRTFDLDLIADQRSKWTPPERL